MMATIILGLLALVLVASTVLWAVFVIIGRRMR